MNAARTLDVDGRDPLPLDNPVQRYDWGSHGDIQELVGLPSDGRPAAELWLGAHAAAPSRTAGTPLPELVAAAPEVVLGQRVTDRFGPRLPYLLKVLAARRALSLQVHPRPHAARAGFHRENRAGLPLGAAGRSFHDEQHKPELLVALTPFEGLAGFRSVRSALELLDELPGDLVARVRHELTAHSSATAMQAALSVLIGARQAPRCAPEVAVAVDAVRERLDDDSATSRADRTVLRLADEHPGDPGAIASLLLNRVSLEPGEAVFIPAGEVHAYLSGLGVEIMAASDNVLRAGLTSKHVDAESLVECASFAPRPPARPDTTVSGSTSLVTTYRAPVEEFGLLTAEIDPVDPISLPPDGPRIVLALDGAVRLLTATGEMSLSRGESCLVPDAAGALTADGRGRITCAWVP